MLFNDDNKLELLNSTNTLYEMALETIQFVLNEFNDKRNEFEFEPKNIKFLLQLSKDVIAKYQKQIMECIDKGDFYKLSVLVDISTLLKEPTNWDIELDIKLNKIGTIYNATFTKALNNCLSITIAKPAMITILNNIILTTTRSLDDMLLADRIEAEIDANLDGDGEQVLCMGPEDNERYSNGISTIFDKCTFNMIYYNDGKKNTIKGKTLTQILNILWDVPNATKLSTLSRFEFMTIDDII